MPAKHGVAVHQSATTRHTCEYSALTKLPTDRRDSFKNSIGLSYQKALLLAGILQVFRMCASVGTWYSIEKWVSPKLPF